MSQTTTATTTLTSQWWSFPRTQADSIDPDSQYQLEEQRPWAHVQSTPVERTAQAALPETKLVLGTPEDDSGFTRG